MWKLEECWVLVAAVGAVVVVSGCSSSRTSPATGAMIAPQEERVAPADPDVARSAFERLKELQGYWEGGTRGPEGRSTTVTSDFRIGAEGHAVIEHGVVGDPMETTTVYYLDRGVLRVTHYCAAGNQPRMYLDSQTTRDRLHFTFDGVTNVDDPDAFHMRLREIDLREDSELVIRWEGVRAGEVLPAGPIRMHRMSDGSYDAR